MNGERVGTTELAPGSTSYDRTLYAQAADVSSSVRSGLNTVEIVLSDGWYRGQAGAFCKPAGTPYRGPKGRLAHPPAEREP